MSVGDTPTLSIIWTITHQRLLDPDEDPFVALGGPDAILGAIQEGEVDTFVEIPEPPWPEGPA